MEFCVRITLHGKRRFQSTVSTQDEHETTNVTIVREEAYTKFRNFLRVEMKFYFGVVLTGLEFISQEGDMRPHFLSFSIS